MSNIEVRGWIEWKLWDKDGNLKVQGENHNIITSFGDQYIANQLLAIPITQPKLVGGGSPTGYMILGSGWSGVGTKANYWPNVINPAVQTATVAKLDVNATSVNATAPNPVLTRSTDSTYSALTNPSIVPPNPYNIVTFQKTWAGATGLTTNGYVNEVCLTSQATDSYVLSTLYTLAYAQITPAVSFTSSDTYTIIWNIQIIGT